MKQNLARALRPVDESAVETVHAVKHLVSACLEAKAQHVTILNIHACSDIADYFVVVSGRSDRHVQGIVNRVVEDLGQKGITPYSVEGYEKAHWVLLDFGNMVLHVFYAPTREHYDLEGLWNRAERVDLPDAEDASARQ